MNPAEFFRVARRLGFPMRIAAVLLLLQLASTIFETIGLSMLLPVFQYIESDGDLAALTAKSQIWRILISSYATIGLSVNLGVLMASSFIAVAGRQVFVYARLVYKAWALQKFLRDVINLCFGRYLHADASYFDSNALGATVNDLTIELHRATTALFGTVALTGLLLVCAVYLSVLISVSAAMALLACAIVGVGIWTLRGLLRRSLTVGRNVTDANQQMASFLTERLRSVRLVRLSGTEQAEISALRKLTDRQRKNMVGLNRLIAAFDVTIEPLVVALGFILLYIGVQVIGLEIGAIGLFLVVVLRLLPVVKEVVKTRQTALGALGAVEAIDNRLGELASAREQTGGAIVFKSLERKIEFRNVRFDYDEARGGPPALDGLSLEIPAHKMTALVGPSGSGKSTLVDMLPRIRRPQSGTIQIDGVPIESFSLQSLRAGIAYAPQAPQFFNVTPAEHIRYGKPEATDDEVRAAAHLAGADKFISMLPDGYDTPLHEGGNRLSGGQRQRLDLARALVRQSSILILDEPTSNLDADSERHLREALARICSGGRITVIAIAHRLSTVEAADQIAVIESGRVTAVGDHASLLKTDNWYSRAFQIQAPDRALA